MEMKRFPNLGDPPFSESNLEVAKKELLEVFPNAVFLVESLDLEVYKPGSQAHKLAESGIRIPVGPEDIIVRTFFKFKTANIHGWEFRRNWYYWCANTSSNPIPENLAKPLNDRLGAYVRVEGFCGGKDVDGPVYSYHIDSVEALSELAKVIMCSR